MMKFQSWWLIGLMLISQSVLAAEVTAPIKIDGLLISGNEVTKRVIIEREITLQAGQRLDSADLVNIENRLNNLNLFHRVEVFPMVRHDSTFLAIVVTEKWYIFPLPFAQWVGPDVDDFTYGFRYAHQNIHGMNRTLSAVTWAGASRGVQVVLLDPWIESTRGTGAIFVGMHQATPEIINGRVNHADQYQLALGGIFRKIDRQNLLRVFGGVQQWELDRRKTIFGKSINTSFVARLEYERNYRDLDELPHSGSYSICWFELNRFRDNWKNRYVVGTDQRGYLPLSKRWTLSGQLLGIASRGEEPDFIRLKLGETIALRGYRDLQQPGQYLAKGGVDLRYTLLSTRYFTWYGAPDWLAKHTRNWKYGLGSSVFSEAGQAWDHATILRDRKLLVTYGTALVVTLPYVNVFRLDVGFNTVDGLQNPFVRADLKAAF